MKPFFAEIVACLVWVSCWWVKFIFSFSFKLMKHIFPCVFSILFFLNHSLAWICFSLSENLLSCSLKWRKQEIVVIFSTQPVLARNPPHCVAAGLWAASLTRLCLISCHVFSGKHPILCNVSVALNFLHFLTTVFTVFLGILSAEESF